jgi:ribonuclease HI/exonuclease III
MPHNTYRTRDEPADSSRSKKKTKATLKIASLNMRGRGIDKWNNINQVIREKKIGILAVQESHLSEMHVNQLHELFHKRMKIFHSIDPDRPNAMGVAIVLNKELTNYKEAKMHILTPGRAILLQTTWHANEKLNILAIYAPNAPSENEGLWVSLRNKWQEQKIPKPDILLGDFNMVEEAIDRLPCHTDQASAIEALQEFKTLLRLQDGWRRTYPTTRAFSYIQNATGAHSRIDRIYLTEKLFTNSYDWNIEAAGIPTDHKMITMSITSPNLPYVGKGRWMIPAHLLKNKKFLKEVQQLSIKLEKEIELIGTSRSDYNNPQILFKKFKDEVIKAAKKGAKILASMAQKQMQYNQQQLGEILNNPSINEEDKQILSMQLEEKLAQAEKSRHQAARAQVAARNKLEGETISKYWTQTTKGKTPRDTIQILKYPGTNPPQVEKNSNKMAELARDYHSNLQTQGMATGLDRQKAMETTIKNIKTAAEEEDKQKLSMLLTEVEVAAALKSLPNGKAAGMDGIPCELWKTLHNQKEDEQTNNRVHKTDIVKIFTSVFNDIENHGMSEGTDFSLGWLCPIYKKNDKQDIANYRPITVLNADYKTFTKALTTKLANTASKLIHEDQAGFMKGRSIFDQIRLSKLLVEYAEAKEENGMIISLDQEKAYDKIAHDYLWKTLEGFQLPQQFINTIKSLYKYAETVVIINGVVSTKFKITRGVRQGDPLSCLLFDLAIEPLPTMLRGSNLTGFQIPGTTQKLITTLFADDTTVYLKERDNYQELQSILTTWCKASGAKFNLTKTEIIPIGSQEYREKLILTRKLNEEHPQIPGNTNIAKDGEPIRILGAWIGNKVDQVDPWSPTLEKIDRSLDQWSRSHPTISGKCLIVQMVVAGMTQFLTKAQGMPAEIEKRLTKRIQTFIWGSNSIPQISMEKMNQATAQGGKKLINLKARNKAIQLTWLKSYLQLDEDRPSWTYIADELINSAVTFKNLDRKTMNNMFIQSWGKTPNARSKLPKDIIEMIKVGHECHVTLQSLKPSQNLKEELPIWYHMGATYKLIELTNKPEARCLRHMHKVQKVRDIYNITKSSSRNHKPRKDCKCNSCATTREITHCANPHKCNKMAHEIIQTLYPKWNPSNQPLQDSLNLTPRRKRRNKQAEISKDPILFDPNVETNTIIEGFRVFAAPQNMAQSPAIRGKAPDGAEQTLTVYTDGSCINMGKANAQAGSGIWYGEDDPRNRALRVPGEMQTNQVAELYAVLQVAKSVPKHIPLLVKSDSEYVIKGLTRNLPKWEDKGWIGVSNSKMMKATAAWLRARENTVTFKWVKGHSGEPGNEGADKKAAEGADLPQEDELKLEAPENFVHTGAKLQTMTQADLYRGLMEQQAQKAAERQGTMVQLDITRWAIEGLSKTLPTNDKIWKSIRSKDISREIREFLWKCLHNAHRCGKYWEKIPQYEHRARCPTCNTEDSMEHILFECEVPGQSTIWSLAKKLWRKKHNNWPNLSYGTVLGCGMANFVNEEGATLKGANRLFKIIISESAYLIWKIRCEQRIGNADNPEATHAEAEIHNRWVATMDRRLTLERLMTNKTRYGKKALKQKVVLQTWEGVLHDRESLPENWIQSTGVLVGTRPKRPPGRNR